MRLILGSGNPSKRAELRRLLRGVRGLALLEPTGPEPPPDEGAASLRGNAEAKACAWASTYRVAAVATDGGLEVPALGARWNPVLTRRAAGAGATDEERAGYLLDLAAGLSPFERTAFVREAAALADAEGRLVESWQVDGTPARLAQAFDPRALPPGFWLPGVLEFGEEGSRYIDLPVRDREAARHHWRALGPPLRDAVQRLMAGELPGRQVDLPAPPGPPR